MENPCKTCSIANKETCCGCPEWRTYKDATTFGKGKFKIENGEFKIEKIRPIATIDRCYTADGEATYLRYKCPKCERAIEGYNAEVYCDKCGTFYDWGTKEPTIKKIVSFEIDWS